jgi:dTDP-4-amino-4,6-dideoxygalactose transaminase
LADSVSFATGRMALFAILKALDLKPGDAVIIPAFTCVVVANAILYAGARPVYAEIEPETYSIDPDKLESALTTRTKAILAQHTFGIPCRLGELLAWADKRGIPLIEDCAHALGGTYQGAPLGSIGTASFFSLDHTKIISTASGGMAASKDAGILHKVRAVQEAAPYVSREHMQKILQGYILQHILGHPRLYFWGKMPMALAVRAGWAKWFANYLDTAPPRDYPFPARLPAVLCRLGLSQLDHLPENIATRTNMAWRFENILGANRRVLEDANSRAAWLRYPFLLHNRAEFLKRIEKYHDLGIWFTSITQCRNERLEEVGYFPGTCPRAEGIVHNIVSLPTHPRMIGLELLASHLKKMRPMGDRLFYYAADSGAKSGVEPVAAFP